MNKFELFASESGDLTARHGDTRILVHSAANPAKEAADVAASLMQNSSANFILIGVGLGYLARELVRHNRLHACYEPFPELQQHAKTGWSAAQNGMEVKGVGDLMLDFANTEIARTTEIVIAPYVRALSSLLDPQLRKTINGRQVVGQSRKLYAPLIERNMRLNESKWKTIPRLEPMLIQCDKPAIAIGAAPSLDFCLDAIRTYREQFLIVAASGALPVLSAANIIPDWVVALEARETVSDDLEFAAEGQRVIVFTWTHPSVLEKAAVRLHSADEGILCTDSGTSALTAADLVLRLSSGTLYLVGMELSNTNGDYANGVNRQSSDECLPAPKFEVMRAALLKWTLANRNRNILHVLPDNVAPVHGINHVSINDFIGSASSSNCDSKLATIA